MAKRVLLVGAGGMGRTWAKNLLANPDTELAGWVDVVPGQVESGCEQLGIQVPAFTSLTEALHSVSPDFVVDVSIPEAHEAVTLESLAFGVPVLGEKPMSTSIASAKRMITASEETGKLYMVSQSRRYDGRQSAFKSLVQQLGGIGILNVDFYIAAHFGGFRDQMQNVLTLDMAIHTFDQAREISGLRPVSVYADEFNPSWSWYAHGSSVNCLFEMEGGCRFTYRGSWCSEGKHTSWEGNWRAVGEKGTALWDGHGNIEGQLIEVSGEVSREFHSSFRDVRAEPLNEPSGIDGSLRDFLHALETGNTPRGECHDNFYSLAMVIAAVESARRGEKVTIEEVLQSSTL